ncbi:MAG TPA: IniB N-terminal domain-containing protein [Pseudonocardia sp.]|jgi:hypothetical protein|uniref:IniB N-terminal domain-containing protein n=1 Tax=Pseudonocardia sp. TaxID=60912 RepID=UPI002B4B4B35|nr:IniB N-terminal domain-containing protein [Pseudonocardia sp.]HLU58728.1 IniB N-terminal domain-containing protein [Pseudonocardia sp.]
MSLIEFLRMLIFNEEAREDFAENPEKALDDAGLGHLSAEDVADALAILHDDSQNADFSRDFNSGGNEINVAAPAPVSGGESAAEYINHYITNNYIDDRDTNIDNSTNLQVDTDGGDFSADIDVDSTVASGDGAVAAGDDIEDSTITTGDGNVVGDNNISGDGNTSISGDGNSAVIGDGNTTGFGSGDVSSTDIGGGVSVDDGSSFAIGGSSSVDNSSYEDNDTSIDASDNSVNDSFNETSSWEDNSISEDNDSYSNYEDSSDHSYTEDNDTVSSDDHSSVDSDYTIQA